MPTTASDLMRWRRSPAKEGEKTAVAARRRGCRFVWSTVVERAHDQFWEVQNHSQRHAPDLYTSAARHRGHDLSDIYHNGLQDDKRPVRIHESPHARMSQNSAIAQEEDLRPGRRPTTAHHRGRPALLGLSRPPRDLVLSWNLVGTPLRLHVIRIATLLSG